MSNDNVIYPDFTKQDEEGLKDKYFAVHSDDGVMHYLGDFEGGEEGFITASKVAAEIGIEPIMVINGGIAHQWEKCIIKSVLLGFAG